MHYQSTVFAPFFSSHDYCMTTCTISRANLHVCSCCLYEHSCIHTRCCVACVHCATCAWIRTRMQSNPEVGGPAPKSNNRKSRYWQLPSQIMLTHPYLEASPAPSCSYEHIEAVNGREAARALPQVRSIPIMRTYMQIMICTTVAAFVHNFRLRECSYKHHEQSCKFACAETQRWTKSTLRLFCLQRMLHL